MSRSAARDELTTTSYALLGLLAIQSWTTYELAQQMDRSLGRFWPRAVSKIYEEPKRLVALGLARSRRELVGRRPRTVYAITPAGRRALRAWLKQPAARGPALEFEAMLKLFFADSGTKADALAAVRSVGAWATADIDQHVAVAREYVSRRGRFPQRAAVTALTGRFVFEFAAMAARWAAWAESVVERWPDDPREAEPEWAAIAEVAALADGAGPVVSGPLPVRPAERPLAPRRAAAGGGAAVARRPPSARRRRAG
jgi:PadR family transcriptional regulator AphA